MIRICVAGVTGWVGQSLAPAILAAPDLELVGAVSRAAKGKRLGEVLHHASVGADSVSADLQTDSPPDRRSGLSLRVSGTVEEALRAQTDVLIDYTAPSSVKGNVLHALTRNVHVVIGTSGLADADYQEIDAAARRNGVGVQAAGNFAIAAVLLQHFALIAARHMPSWEVIDYAAANKPDAPSGTARELVHRLAKVRSPQVEIPIDATQGAPEARGLTLDGTQVHSIRVPGQIIGLEVIFGQPSQRLSLRYDGGSGAEPYVEGTLLAARGVGSFVGLRRGLDQLLGLAAP
jgi:4-hydroxy-tetrahydrodipicolinate reductase